MAERKSNMGAGILFGAAVGFIAGLFMAPKSGKETRDQVAKKLKELKRALDDGELRERVEDMFGEVTDEGMKMYKNARKTLIKKLDEMKDDVDFDAYKNIVDDVVETIRDETKGATDKLAALKDTLLEEWTDAEPEIKKTIKKISKSKK